MAVNRSSATGKAWSIGEVQLNVTGNTSDYILPVGPEFGKPLSVLTLYNQVQSWIPRYVDFWEVNNLFYDWGLPANIASSYYNWDGSPCTASRMAFYRKPDDSSIWVRVLPMPMLAASYTVMYSQGTWASEAAITDSPLLSQFHPLIEMWATENLLAHAAWWSDDNADGRKANQERRKEISMAQAELKKNFEDDFSRFIRSTNDPGITTRHSVFSDGFWG